MTFYEPCPNGQNDESSNFLNRNLGCPLVMNGNKKTTKLIKSRQRNSLKGKFLRLTIVVHSISYLVPLVLLFLCNPGLFNHLGIDKQKYF